MTDLSDCTSAELIEELKKRSKAIVLGMDPLADKSTFLVITAGNKLSSAGLVRALTLNMDYILQDDPRDRKE